MNSNVICAILRKQILTVITTMLAFQSCDQHTWQEQLERRKVCFGLMVLEVIVHGQTTSLFWALREGKHHGGRVWRSKVAQFTTTRKQRETDRQEIETEQGTRNKNVNPKNACPQSLVPLATPYLVVLSNY